jgi:hypothetical protein
VYFSSIALFENGLKWASKAEAGAGFLDRIPRRYSGAA